MAKIEKKVISAKKIEGYVDPNRNAFIVTGDPHGLLSELPEAKSVIEEETEHKNVVDLLKKYKPNFLK